MKGPEPDRVVGLGGPGPREESESRDGAEFVPSGGAGSTASAHVLTQFGWYVVLPWMNRP